MTSQRPRLLLVPLAAAFVLLPAGCGGKTAATSTSSPAASTTTAAATTTVATASPTPSFPLSFPDPTTALGYVDRGLVSRQGSIDVHDISYLTPEGRLQGYLVEPHGASKLPGVVFVPGGGGDRSELLDRALALAQRGMVALTITEVSTAYPLSEPLNNMQRLEDAREVTVGDVVAVRRAADVLQSLPSVDPARLGYLGWSNGAKTGAIVAASDKRFKAFALLSAGADPVSAFVAHAPSNLRAQARAILGSVDPLRYIAAARFGTVLLEDGNNDSIVPHEALENFIAAAPRGTVIHWYQTDHALNAAAYTSAFDWFALKLV